MHYSRIKWITLKVPVESTAAATYGHAMPTGHIELLKGGGHRVVVYAGKDPITGRKAYLKETHPTAAEVETARLRLLSQVDADIHPDRAATVSVLLERWMAVVDHELTTAGYGRRTIEPALGSMTLRKIQHRVDLLDRFYTHLRRCNVLCDGRRGPDHTCKPMSAGGVRRVHIIISAAFSYAMSWGWMDRNPAEYAHLPKLPRRRERPPEPEQVARLLNLVMATDVEFGLFLWLAVTTGARRGELTALRWSRVDKKRLRLTVDTNCVQRVGESRLKEPKQGLQPSIKSTKL